MDREDEEEEFDEDAPYPLPLVAKIEKSEESDEEGGTVTAVSNSEKRDSKVQGIGHSSLSTDSGDVVSTTKIAIKNEGPGAAMREIKGEDAEEAQIEFELPLPAERSGLVDEVGVMEPSVPSEIR